jgi:hypothetical protein
MVRYVNRHTPSQMEIDSALEQIKKPTLLVPASDPCSECGGDTSHYRVGFGLDGRDGWIWFPDMLQHWRHYAPGRDGGPTPPPLACETPGCLGLYTPPEEE